MTTAQGPSSTTEYKIEMLLWILLAAHTKVGYITRHSFIQTVRRYYLPELERLGLNISGLRSDLEHGDSSAVIRALRRARSHGLLNEEVLETGRIPLGRAPGEFLKHQQDLTTDEFLRAHSAALRSCEMDRKARQNRRQKLSVRLMSDV